jgi:hypothetical protein
LLHVIHGRSSRSKIGGSHVRWIRFVILLASTLFAALLLAPPAWAAATVSFAAPINVTVGGGPASVAVGDFNRDGNPDLAVANQLIDTVSVLLGSASGGFTRQTPDLAVGGFPTSVAVGDFNGDQDPDLAVASGFGTVSVLLGGSGASFTRQPDLAIGGTPWSVAVGDFNGDHDPDLAVANQLSNNVSVLLGGVGGSFIRQTPDLAVGSGPTSVAVGDFNGDSDPDLAVANQFDGTVSVLLGTSGGGGFSGPTLAGNYKSGLDLMSVAVGDFNGDGDPTSPSATCHPARSGCSWVAMAAASAARPTSPRAAACPRSPWVTSTLMAIPTLRSRTSTTDGFRCLSAAPAAALAARPTSPPALVLPRSR